MKQTHQNLRASILDRLIDHEPDLSREPVPYCLVSIGQIKASVVRDIENLLNTRRQILILPVEYSQVNDSLFVYGLQDFTSKNPGSPFVKQQLRQDIEKTISQFEPRLKNVSVHLETTAQNKRTLRFRIKGMLVVEPVAEPVTFDTYFDANKGEYIISR
ncbi:MAG: type VI secretion system baseplate subunit TssE [Deltaproteobacteria bacterium]|nr:type VI secretion system baseplate subunit TssE [Deltaproteobacteria bacterium]